MLNLRVKLTIALLLFGGLALETLGSEKEAKNAALAELMAKRAAGGGGPAVPKAPGGGVPRVQTPPPAPVPGLTPPPAPGPVPAVEKRRASPQVRGAYDSLLGALMANFPHKRAEDADLLNDLLNQLVIVAKAAGIEIPDAERPHVEGGSMQVSRATGDAYVRKMTPEEKQRIEEHKRKLAEDPELAARQAAAEERRRAKAAAPATSRLTP